MLHGNDISAYQGTTAPAVDFVHVKATEGNGYRSSKFTAQWKSAKSRAKHRGGYHFARPEQSSAKDQLNRLLDMVQPVRGESVMLDLEASKLTQSGTNKWARSWGDLLRDQADWLTSIVYMGSGYATNGTGRDLDQHFDYWMYPQYPSAYQLMGLPLGAQALEIEETRRAMNRTEAVPERTPIAAMTSRWPSSLTPWLPSGLTCGWTRPHIWQFTDNFNGLDASVSTLTLDQLAGGGEQETPLEDTMPYGGQLQPGAGTKANISFPKGSMGAIGLVYDSPDVAEVRVAFHRKTAGGGEVYTLKVGGPASDKDSWPAKTVQKFKAVSDGDWVSLTRLDDGTDPVGWDMS